MQKTVAILFLALIVQPVAALAGPASPVRISEPIARQLGQPNMIATRTKDVSAQQSSTSDPSWMRRHPVLFGVLVGAGAGALGGATFGHSCKEESFCRRGGMMQIGAAGGAGVGALAGFVFGLIK